ncbi:MAG: glycosyltransferase family 87 protein [Chitinophagaceae bacterium]|nr:glycosyltransferase family 87 protein [Chitinophagaceae bacterium]
MTKQILIKFFSHRFFLNKKYIIGIIFLLSTFAAVHKYTLNSYNNYKIFKGVYYHFVQKLNLYATYPQEYGDANHYGPFFSLIIAPFAILPDIIGVILWNICTVLVFIIGIWKLPIYEKYKVAIFWITLNELYTSIVSFQFNPALVGLILLTFVFLEKNKLFLASLSLLIGFFVKIYGIVGIAFFFFIKRKTAFVITFLITGIVLFFLPTILSDLSFLTESYFDWKESLIHKNAENESHQHHMSNISFLGLCYKILGIYIHPLIGVAIGSFFLILILARYSQHNNFYYRLFVLVDILFCIILFNTGTESPTFIIAYVGIAIWFLLSPKNTYILSLFIFAFIITSLSPTDIFPEFIRNNYIRPYALKALPCLIIWIDITYKLLFYDFHSAVLEKKIHPIYSES